MSDYKVAYLSSGTFTCTLASLASSSGLTAGRASASISNTTNLAMDYLLAGKITTGTNPTVGTIEVWAIPALDDTPDWPDTFGGTDSAVTVTSRSKLLNFGKLVASIIMDSASSSLEYDFQKPASAVFGGPVPKTFQLFVTHNTVAALHATGGNHVLSQTGVYATVV